MPYLILLWGLTVPLSHGSTMSYSALLILSPLLCTIDLIAYIWMPETNNIPSQKVVYGEEAMTEQ